MERTALGFYYQDGETTRDWQHDTVLRIRRWWPEAAPQQVFGWAEIYNKKINDAACRSPSCGMCSRGLSCRTEDVEYWARLLKVSYAGVFLFKWPHSRPLIHHVDDVRVTCNSLIHLEPREDVGTAADVLGRRKARIVILTLPDTNTRRTSSDTRASKEVRKVKCQEPPVNGTTQAVRSSLQSSETAREQVRGWCGPIVDDFPQPGEGATASMEVWSDPD